MIVQGLLGIQGCVVVFKFRVKDIPHDVAHGVIVASYCVIRGRLWDIVGECHCSLVVGCGSLCVVIVVVSKFRSKDIAHDMAPCQELFGLEGREFLFPRSASSILLMTLRDDCPRNDCSEFSSVVGCGALRDARMV